MLTAAVRNTITKNLRPNLHLRTISTTQCRNKSQAGRYRITPKKNLPLTYEMANPPHTLAHRKSWNSWNTSNVEGGLRAPEIAIEDVFIRKFLSGTWHALFVSEIIIKRQHNIIRIAGIVHRGCPVKLELQTVADKREVVFKYV